MPTKTRSSNMSVRLLHALAYLQRMKEGEQYDSNDHMHRFGLSRATSRRDFSLLIKAVGSGIAPGFRVGRKSYGRRIIYKRRSDG